jgi:hypothetical protein
MKRIVIIAGGPSQYKCPDTIEDGEIWGINSLAVGYKTIKLDRIFLLHDVLMEILFRNHNFIGKLNAMGVPIYTAGPAPIFENNVEFPITEVVNAFKIGFFLNTIAYMIAYAIMQKPEEIHLYGVDMRPDAENESLTQQKGCIEFWCGVATGRNIRVFTPPESYVMKRTMVSNWYAFEAQASSDGAIEFVQRTHRGKYNKYRIAPCDEIGNEIDNAIILTPDGPIEVAK